jgi:hypothetical protein
MRARITRLWRITTVTERFVTVMTPILPILAAVSGDWLGAGTGVVAGLWWSLYLSEKLTVDDLLAEIFIRDLMHRTFVHVVHLAAEQRRKKTHQADPKKADQTTSSIRIPRAHR